MVSLLSTLRPFLCTEQCLWVETVTCNNLHTSEPGHSRARSFELELEIRQARRPNRRQLGACSWQNRTELRCMWCTTSKRTAQIQQQPLSKQLRLSSSLRSSRARQHALISARQQRPLLLLATSSVVPRFQAHSSAPFLNQTTTPFHSTTRASLHTMTKPVPLESVSS